LSCFPSTRHPDISFAKIAALRVGKLTLHDDREVSQAALVGLQSFSLLNPTELFVFSGYIIIEELMNIEQAATSVLKSLNNLSFLLISFAEFLQKHPGVIMRKKDWVVFRQHCEAISLIWIMHSEAWLREEMLRFLDIFKKKSFLAIENNDCVAESPLFFEKLLAEKAEKETEENKSDYKKGPQRRNKHSRHFDSDKKIVVFKDEYSIAAAAELELSANWEKVPFLSDYLRLDQLDELKSGHDLVRLIDHFFKNGFSQFRGLISYAWMKIFPIMNELFSKRSEQIKKDGDIEWLSLWNNRFLFLCYGSQVIIDVDPKQDKILDFGYYDDFYKLCQQCNTSVRPSFTNLFLQRSLADQFCREVFIILHGSDLQKIHMDCIFSLSMMPCISFGYILRKHRGMILKYTKANHEK
jgi:hypothetical protein